MVHPSVLQEDRLRELDRLLQRVTQRAVEAASTRDHKPTPPTLPQGEILTPLFYIKLAQPLILAPILFEVSWKAIAHSSWTSIANCHNFFDQCYMGIFKQC